MWTMRCCGNEYYTNYSNIVIGRNTKLKRLMPTYEGMSTESESGSEGDIEEERAPRHAQAGILESESWRDFPIELQNRL